MIVFVKICGLSPTETLDVALDTGTSILTVERPITQATDPDLAVRAFEATQ